MSQIIFVSREGNLHIIISQGASTYFGRTSSVMEDAVRVGIVAIGIATADELRPIIDLARGLIHTQEAVLPPCPLVPRIPSDLSTRPCAESHRDHA